MNEIGFIDYLLIVISVLYSWRAFHAAQPPPAGAKTQATQPLLDSDTPTGRLDALALPETENALGRTLKRIAFAARYASIDVFLDGAKMTYETVIEAFAVGDIAGCHHLLSVSVRDSFTQAITDRAAREETAELVFIGFRAVTIVDAGLNQDYAWIEVRFDADLVSVNYNRDGRVVSGAPGQVTTASEVWTFERDLRGRGPDWLLTATEYNA
ncbi:Tim44/TimA family putative adaptor protein [Devosia alba]|uniref:Tim44/TimA family putative adaptor protein n=1 Tax=Devosia alba TaxID=3152360 RepID=UPI0032650F34